MNESLFAEKLAKKLRMQITNLEIDTKISLLYSISFDDEGNLDLHLGEDLRPKRGKGKGFEQDILIYNIADGKTSLVPRVIAEVKYEKVGTHSAIVYTEKLRRIKSIYPYVRYGLILGKIPHIPARVLRFGQEFDFIQTISFPFRSSELNKLVRLLKKEANLSKKLAKILTGKKKLKCIHRQIRMS